MATDLNQYIKQLQAGTLGTQATVKPVAKLAANPGGLTTTKSYSPTPAAGLSASGGGVRQNRGPLTTPTSQQTSQTVQQQAAPVQSRGGGSNFLGYASDWNTYGPNGYGLGVSYSPSSNVYKFTDADGNLKYYLKAKWNGYGPNNVWYDGSGSNINNPFGPVGESWVDDSWTRSLSQTKPGSFDFDEYADGGGSGGDGGGGGTSAAYEQLLAQMKAQYEAQLKAMQEEAAKKAAEEAAAKTAEQERQARIADRTGALTQSGLWDLVNKMYGGNASDLNSYLDTGVFSRRDALADWGAEQLSPLSQDLQKQYAKAISGMQQKSANAGFGDASWTRNVEGALRQQQRALADLYGNAYSADKLYEILSGTPEAIRGVTWSAPQAVSTYGNGFDAFAALDPTLSTLIPGGMDETPQAWLSTDYKSKNPWASIFGTGADEDDRGKQNLKAAQGFLKTVLGL